MGKNRIEYIDLMKGICIIMVVLLHCGFFTGKLAAINEYLKLVRMPLYFFLSGLFFKSYGSFFSFFLKKINNLVIPYLFFSLLYLIYFTFSAHDKIDYLSWKYYFFGFLEPYNYPLWFLRSLFTTYIIYYGLNKLTERSFFKIIISFIISIAIWYITPSIKELNSNLFNWIFIRQNLLSSLFALPYIAVATYLKQKGLLSLSLTMPKALLLLCFSTSLLIMFYTDDFGLKSANYGNNLIYLYISSFSGIFAIYSLARIFNKLYFISYVGRYSIIVLGMHIIFRILVIDAAPNIAPWQLSLVVLLLCPCSIYVLKKYFPYFTAQKDLIQIKSH